MKRIFLLILLVTAFCAGSFAQTEQTLSKKDQSNSALFKSLKGQNRVSVYKELQTLIKVKDAAADQSTSKRMGVKTTTLEEVIMLLGEPDNKIQQTIIEYILNGKAASTKLVIGINKSNEVQFCTVKNN